MYKKNKILIRVGLLLLVITFFFAANNAEAKFPSKNITFIVPVTPGGGFDTATRLLVPYLEKYLPGHPNVIVKNIPGGEWSIGINKMYRSKPDGHTVCIFNMPGNATSQVLGSAKFDLNKVTWIGNISEVVYVTALAKTSKYKTLKELQNAPEVTSGVVGLASTAGLGTIIAAERMGIKMKPIPTDGSVQAILAAIRGDVDWVQYPIETLKKSIVDSQDLTPVWVFSKKRLDLLPDVPTVAELGYKDLLDIVAMSRPVGAPPDLPKDILKIWEDAFSKAVNDPEFQQKMIKANHTPSPMTSEETALMVKQGVEEVAKYKSLLEQYIK
ncbi:MAG: tripartite tricarboxylate transporter substrate binding protein [Desulfobacterales bacterium]|nr:tripartite tricarboxylate transporter substrate binding protein [Desulfobacterales bacterium]